MHSAKHIKSRFRWATRNKYFWQFVWVFLMPPFIFLELGKESLENLKVIWGEYLRCRTLHEYGYWHRKEKEDA